MIRRPDLTPLHDVADLALTQAAQHVPADRLLAIVPPIRLELIALRLGARSDASELLRLVRSLPVNDATTEEARAAFRQLRQRATELAPWVNK